MAARHCCFVDGGWFRGVKGGKGGKWCQGAEVSGAGERAGEMGGRREYGGWIRERGKRRGSLDLCSTDLQRGRGETAALQRGKREAAPAKEGKGAAVTVELQRGKRAADLQMGKVGGGGGGGGTEGGGAGGTERK
ncbi:uncharacterized protein LOC131009847 [Salvia miltiorrhiza]|uniref:uncharacterized protein LOC131009847 n=1 Tax=Salvia miltiorrhiza TaxID=226208 RepID=UPI0025ACDA62|nr:uncharacterized protein LOC131009847 [Salvia miltiorrhiza]